MRTQEGSDLERDVRKCGERQDRIAAVADNRPVARRRRIKMNVDRAAFQIEDPVFGDAGLRNDAGADRALNLV